MIDKIKTETAVMKRVLSTVESYASEREIAFPFLYSLSHTVCWKNSFSFSKILFLVWSFSPLLRLVSRFTEGFIGDRWFSIPWFSLIILRDLIVNYIIALKECWKSSWMTVNSLSTSFSLSFLYFIILAFIFGKIS